MNNVKSMPIITASQVKEEKRTPIHISHDDLLKSWEICKQNDWCSMIKTFESIDNID